MKIKKALIPLALTALLALAATPALAANTITQGAAPTYTNTGVTNVAASVDTTYTITIPDSDTLKFQNLKGTSEETARTKTFDVSAKDVTLEPGKQLNVTVSGTDSSAFQMANDALKTVKLPYKLWNKKVTAETETGNLNPGDTFASFANGSTDTVTSTLVVAAPTMGAGNYSDTLTFTCTVADKTP